MIKMYELPNWSPASIYRLISLTGARHKYVRKNISPGSFIAFFALYENISTLTKFIVFG